MVFRVAMIVLQLIIMYLQRRLDKSTQQDVLILDFSKAFDKVTLVRLLSELKHCGVGRRVYCWIKLFIIG